MLTLPERNQKPRTVGLTSLHDTFLTKSNLKSILDDYGEFIDIAKFGVGTAFITPNLKDKIKLYHDHNVDVYFGGTLFEKFVSQGKLNEYIEFNLQNNVKIIEVSTGTIELSIDDRLSIIQKLKRDFKVLAEVGSKDNDKVMTPTHWIEEINSLIDAGASYVITEGRNSGTAGIFRPTGEIRMGLVGDILTHCDINKIIFEAPIPKAQMYFINAVGANVNLGNINPNDVLLLETQRKALRSETFNL